MHYYSTTSSSADRLRLVDGDGYLSLCEQRLPDGGFDPVVVVSVDSLSLVQQKQQASEIKRHMQQGTSQ